MKHLYWTLGTVATLAIAFTLFFLARTGDNPASPPPALPAPAQHSAQRAPAPRPLITLIDQLVSDDPAIRAAANEQLAAWPQSRRGELHQLAERTTLEDVAERLRRRIMELDVERMLNPPPISLQLTNASLDEVVSQLTVAIGVPVYKASDLMPAGLFTLEAKDTPFWEVIAALSKQSPIRLSGFKDRFALIRIRPGTGIEQASIQGAFILSAYRAGTPESPELHYALAADPRTLVMGGRLDLTVLDAEGKTLADGNRSLIPPDFMNVYFEGNVHESTLPLRPLLEISPTKTIATIKAHARIAIATRSETVNIPDVEAQSGKPLQVGRSTVDVTFARRERGGIQFSLKAMNGRQQEFVAYRLLDATGNVISGRASLGGASMGSGAEPPGPRSLEVRTAHEIKWVEYDFELRQPQ